MAKRIETKDLNIYYGKFLAVSDVTLTVAPRSVTAFIGPSGCGKSTFLRTLNRMHEVTPGGRVEGSVRLDGEELYAPGVDPVAVRRIFAAKARPRFNPVIAHVADVDGARALVTAWPAAAARLAAAFWPGPLTLVLPKRAHVPDEVTAGLPAVAVRVPAHPVALALVRAAGVPIAAPSARPAWRKYRITR